MLKVLDVWEADVNLDAPVLKKAGVVGIIVRLNDMNGGHHKDEKFDELWAWAKAFPVRAAYFVYNPWVSGPENARWLLANLPADYSATRRVFIDIEVRYDKITADEYAREVRSFLALVKKQQPVAIYTGGGFVELLNPWPASEDYWWARYPSVFWPPKTTLFTWEQWDELALRQGFNPDPMKLCRGSIKLWQCSADRVILPGFGGRAVDVNLFNGSLPELAAWFGSPLSETVPTPLSDGDLYAIVERLDILIDYLARMSAKNIP